MSPQSYAKRYGKRTFCDTFGTLDGMERRMDVDPDPAIIAMIASSAANQEQATGPVTLVQLIYCVAVVVAVAGLTVWAVSLIPIWV